MNKTIHTTYNAEREKNVFGNQSIIWTDKIGLIYASDYGYSSTDKECRNDLRAGLTLIDSKIDTTEAKCKNNNWLYKNASYFTISTCSWNPGFAFYQISSGTIDNNGSAVYLNMSVFPSLYLTTSTKIINGIGTKTDPYKLQ